MKKPYRDIDNLSPDRIADIKRRLLAKTAIGDGCWEWGGAHNLKGYGSLSIGNGVTALVHRLSYRIHRGPVGNHFVCHRCDNPKCINPDHLFLGTPTDNVRDMHRKRRNKPSRKLTDAEVRAIREQFAAGGQVAQIAEEFSADPSYIYQIARGVCRLAAGGPLTPTYTRRHVSMDTAQRIRAAHRAGEGSLRRLAETYKVGQTTVYRIVNYQSHTQSG